MNTYVSMLRGINVSGQKQIKMEQLQALYVALGHSGVTTYIQSGNVIFTSASDRPAELARGIEQGIARDLGLAVTVLLRSKDELARVIDGNPFPRQGADPGKLHVTFLGAHTIQPSPATLRCCGLSPTSSRSLARRSIFIVPRGMAGRS